MRSDTDNLTDLRGMDPVTLTPREFERFVAATLTEQGVGLSGFEVQHLHRIAGTDGDYVIDVSARFEALGADFLVLIECKHQNTKVKRGDVQLLADKVRSTGAHKGMLFATAGFQSGAVAYARTRGVALVHVADGRTSYETKAGFGRKHYPPGLPRFLGWLRQINLEGRQEFSYLGKVELERVQSAFEERVT